MKHLKLFEEYEVPTTIAFGQKYISNMTYDDLQEVKDLFQEVADEFNLSLVSDITGNQNSYQIDFNQIYKDSVWSLIINISLYHEREPRNQPNSHSPLHNALISFSNRLKNVGYAVSDIVDVGNLVTSYYSIKITINI